MMKESILIVEDEVLIAQDIKATLEKSKYRVIGIAINASQAYEFLSHNNIDLVLLDINISGSVSGIEIAEYINQNYHLPFIYLTSYNDKDTLDNLKETRPIGYQPKPINDVSFITALDLYFQSQKDQRIFVKFGEVEYSFVPNDILYVQSAHVYTEVHSKEKMFLVRSTLKNFIAQMPPNFLIRINRSTAINPIHIQKKSSTSIEINGQSFPISKVYSSNL